LIQLLLFFINSNLFKVKISKDDSDSDVEIDVEDSDELNADKAIIEDVRESPKSEMKKIENENCDSAINSKQQKIYIDLSTLDELIAKELTSLEKPQAEVNISENYISELEKVVHSEFFEGRPTKTPLRYLKVVLFC
jgi:protein MYSM1